MIINSYILFVAELLTLIVFAVVLIALATRAVIRVRGTGKKPSMPPTNALLADYSAMIAGFASALARGLDGIGQDHASIPAAGPRSKTAYILSIDDAALSGRLAALKREISALLMLAQDTDIIVVRLKSGGGAVPAYGGLTAQVSRLTSRRLRVVASIDEVAVSGGFMIATAADEIIAAPFAHVGSIGLVSTQLNFAGITEKFGISNEVIASNPAKVTPNAFSKTADDTKERHLHHLRSGHDIWCQLIQEKRPHVDLKNVANGQSWFAAEALAHGLIDRIMTFDDFALTHYHEYKFVEISTKNNAPKGGFKNGLARIVTIMSR